MNGIKITKLHGTQAAILSEGDLSLTDATKWLQRNGYKWFHENPDGTITATYFKLRETDSTYCRNFDNLDEAIMAASIRGYTRVCKAIREVLPTVRF